MDARLHALIDQLRDAFGKNCQRESETSWRFEVMTEAGRSQVVTLYLRRTADSEHDLARFVAFSPIGPLGGDINFEAVLRKNAELDVGAIAIEDIWTSDNVRLPFLVFRATHLASTMDYPELWELVTKTGEYADQLEKTTFAKDLY